MVENLEARSSFANIGRFGCARVLLLRLQVAQIVSVSHVVDGVNIYTVGILGVREDIDSVRDERPIKILKLQSLRFQGLDIPLAMHTAD